MAYYRSGPPQLVPIATIEVFGNSSTPTETILHALGNQPGDMWDYQQNVVVQDHIRDTCGLREVEIVAMHFPPAEGVFMTIDVVEAEAPEWNWLPEPTGEIALPEDIEQVLEQRRNGWSKIAFAGPIMMRRVEGGRMRTEDDAVGSAEDQLAALANQHQDALIDALANASNAKTRRHAAEALAHATNSQALIDALLAALRDPDVSVRNQAANVVQSRVWSRHETPTLQFPLDPLIDMLFAPFQRDREMVGGTLNALAEEQTVRDHIRVRAHEQLRRTASRSGPHGGNMAQRILDRLTLDDPVDIQITTEQLASLAATVGAFVEAASAEQAAAEVDSNQAAPAHLQVSMRHYPGMFEHNPADNDEQPQVCAIRPPRNTITPHTVTPIADERYNVLARRTFGFAVDRELPPFRGELRWDGTRWWVWSADM